MLYLQYVNMALCVILTYHFLLCTIVLLTTTYIQLTLQLECQTASFNLDE